MTWPIYISTQMNDLDNMVDPDFGLLPMNYAFHDWPTSANDPKAYDPVRWEKTITRFLPTATHYMGTERPNPQDWQIIADDPAIKGYNRRFRPNSPFFLDIEFTERLQLETERDTAIAIIDDLRGTLVSHYGAGGAMIGYYTLGMDWVNSLNRPDSPNFNSSKETLLNRVRTLNRAYNGAGRFDARAFQDVVDYWCPFVFRIPGDGDKQAASVIKNTMKICRKYAPKQLLPGWFPYRFGSGEPLDPNEIRHDLKCIREMGADGLVLLGNFHDDANGQASGNVFTSTTQEYGLVKAFAKDING
tara:strand:- start:589 stop:1494 length:906 start_codon:yes stop_codon:yes gene_type:complete